MRVPSGDSEGAAFSGYPNRTSRGMSSTEGTRPIMPRSGGGLLAAPAPLVESQANCGADVACDLGPHQRAEAQLRGFSRTACRLRDAAQFARQAELAEG